MIKKNAVTALMMGAWVLSAPFSSVFASTASDGTVSFTGGIAAQTCSISVGGGNAHAPGVSNTVSLKLPTVGSSTLRGAPGATKGGTLFSFNLSGCSGGTLSMARVNFEAGSTVQDDGTLQNQYRPVIQQASGVALQLVDSNNNAIVIGSPDQASAAVHPVSGPMSYSARYVSENSVVGPGNFQSSVTYSITYQ